MAYHAVKDRILAILYYHHRTPELIQKDVKGLSRLPEHLSVILKLEGGGRGGAALEALVDEVAEIAAWCACIGIPLLSVYEQSGMCRYERELEIILTYFRHSQRLRSSNSQSSNKKAVIVFRTPASSCVTSSSSHTLHGISIQHTNHRRPTSPTPSFIYSSTFSRRWPRLIGRSHENFG
jgi:hypothetical protein